MVIAVDNGQGKIIVVKIDHKPLRIISSLEAFRKKEKESVEDGV